MEQFNAVLNQVLIFMIIMIIGFISYKSKFLPESTLPVISTIFSRLIVPFIVFANTVSGATRADMKEHAYLVGIYACVFASLIVISRILPKLLRIKGDRASLFSLASSFGNVGYVGIPLLLSIFGQRAMMFVTMYAVVDQTLFWTYGITLTYPADNKPKFRVKTLVNMINPALIAILLSITLILLNVKLPMVLDRAFTTISNTGMALPFIYIGGVLSMMKIKDLLKYYEIGAVILVKMLIIPMCIFLILRSAGIPSEIVIVSALLFGLPVIGMSPMLASANGSDSQYATVMVLVTTIASLITYPLITYVTALI